MDERQEQWIESALSGDQVACREIYALHAPRVKAYFLRSGFCLVDADDLTQETFLRVFRSLGTFDPQRGPFRSWVAAIARNAARRRWAGRAKPEDFDPELAEEVLTGNDDPDASAQEREEIEAVRQCVQALPGGLQRVIRLRYVDGRTTRGIAAETKLPEATVRLRIEEARRQIEKCLRGKGVIS